MSKDILDIWGRDTSQKKKQRIICSMSITGKKASKYSTHEISLFQNLSDCIYSIH